MSKKGENVSIASTVRKHQVGALPCTHWELPVSHKGLLWPKLCPPVPWRQLNCKNWSMWGPKFWAWLLPKKGQFQSALWPGLLPSVSAKSVSWEVKAKCEDGGGGIKEPRWEEMGVPPICPYTDSLTPLLYNFNNFKWRNLKPDEHALAE